MGKPELNRFGILVVLLSQSLLVNLHRRSETSTFCEAPASDRASERVTAPEAPLLSRHLRLIFASPWSCLPLRFLRGCVSGVSSVSSPYARSSGPAQFYSVMESGGGGWCGFQRQSRFFRVLHPAFVVCRIGGAWWGAVVWAPDPVCGRVAAPVRFVA
ncbi:hypothetical protein Rs2_20722 [Raphanus sativus]|nr:hypothetical protein Rs2_20722 [Raphanus sativus]